MLFVHGLGHFHPENQIDNKFLEELDIGTNDEWIVSRVGISNRRTVLPLDYIKATKNQDLRAGLEAAIYSNAETGKRAALMAIERAGIKPSDIGMVIAGDSSPDNCIPPEASTIAKLLEIEVPAIDFSVACSTFGAQLHFVRAMGQNLPEYVLCVVPENTTRVTDYSDRSSAILFGDASAAAVVSTKIKSKIEVTHSVFGGAPSGAFDVHIPRFGHFRQNGAAVQKFAIKRMVELLREIQARDPSHPYIYVGHQANLTMLEAVTRRCEIPLERHYFNIDQYGNQAAAGAPAVMSQRWNDWKPGDRAACVVVGSGLSWSSLEIVWS
ncbi:MAG: ketoacyl-ACP synthase III [Myxococcales bacterium]|nr:ketoacyl-ACP synthase III [Myxococcales bacterium]